MWWQLAGFVRQSRIRNPTVSGVRAIVGTGSLLSSFTTVLGLLLSLLQLLLLLLLLIPATATFYHYYDDDYYSLKALLLTTRTFNFYYHPKIPTYSIESLHFTLVYHKTLFLKIKAPMLIHRDPLLLSFSHSVCGTVGLERPPHSLLRAF